MRHDAGSSTLDALDRYSPYALAALRIVAALIFMEHGTQKLFGFPAPSEGGQPPLLSLRGVGGVLEFAGGLLILVGPVHPARGVPARRARWRWRTGCSTPRGASSPC